MVVEVQRTSDNYYRVRQFNSGAGTWQSQEVAGKHSKSCKTIFKLCRHAKIE